MQPARQGTPSCRQLTPRVKYRLHRSVITMISSLFGMGGESRVGGRDVQTQMPQPPGGRGCRTHCLAQTAWCARYTTLAFMTCNVVDLYALGTQCPLLVKFPR